MPHHTWHASACSKTLIAATTIRYKQQMFLEKISFRVGGIVWKWTGGGGERYLNFPCPIIFQRSYYPLARLEAWLLFCTPREWEKQTTLVFYCRCLEYLWESGNFCKDNLNLNLQLLYLFKVLYIYTTFLFKMCSFKKNQFKFKYF